MLCDRCDKEIGARGELPTLALKTLGLYETPYQVLALVRASFNVTGNVTNAEIGTADITNASFPRIFPRSLHRLPGLAVNAYPLLKDSGLRMRLIAGTTATPAIINALLKFRDVSDVEYLLGVISNLSLVALSSEAAISFNHSPTIGGQVLGELPSKLGTFVLEGTIALGTATNVSIECYTNYGIVYGAPK